MGTGCASRRSATYLLIVLAALLTVLSGPSAAVHSEVADPKSAPHIHGLSPHGDDATTRVASTEDDPASSTGRDQRCGPGPDPRLRWLFAAAAALGPPFAVTASPWSGRSPPQAGLPAD